MVGCGTTDSSGPLVGFDVKSEETVEIGQYYTPEIPTVTQDGEQLHVSVSAVQDGKELYFNGDNALLVENFDDIFEPFARRKGSKWETHFKRKI